VEHADAATGYGVGRFGIGPYGEDEWRITISWDGRSHDALEFVAGVVESWQGFFQDRGVNDLSGGVTRTSCGSERFKRG
jgi:hypothetical protein